MMEEMGIVRRSKSHFASPLHMVRKPDGSRRPCGDYKRLNASTNPTGIRSHMSKTTRRGFTVNASFRN